MKTTITMTPEELEAIKNEVAKNILMGLCTGHLSICTEPEYSEKNTYKISGTSRIKKINYDRYYRIEELEYIDLPEIYLDANDMVPTLKAFAESDNYHSYVIKDFKLDKE